MDVGVGVYIDVAVGVGVRVRVGVGVDVDVGVRVDVAVGVGVGVEVGLAVSLQPGMALQTFRLPPVVVLHTRLEIESTLFRIALLSWATVRPPCPGADRINAAAPVT